MAVCVRDLCAEAAQVGALGRLDGGRQDGARALQHGLRRNRILLVETIILHITINNKQNILPKTDIHQLKNFISNILFLLN